MVLATCGCAPLTEQQKYQRADRMNLVVEEYGRKEEACRRVGGTMQFSVPQLAKAGYHDYRQAKCVRL